MSFTFIALFGVALIIWIVERSKKRAGRKSLSTYLMLAAVLAIIVIMCWQLLMIWPTCSLNDGGHYLGGVPIAGCPAGRR
jgi:hypothetical protein